MIFTGFMVMKEKCTRQFKKQKSSQSRLVSQKCSTELRKPNRPKNPGRRVSSRQLFAVPYGWGILTLPEMHRQAYRFTAAYTRRSMCIHPNITLTGGMISICRICLTAPLVKTSQHTACWKRTFALEI